MIQTFKLKNNHLINTELGSNLEEDLKKSVWVDLLEPNDEERKIIKQYLNQTLPENHELEDLESSARFFEDDYGLHLHSFFYYEEKNDEEDGTNTKIEEPNVASVAFTIHNNSLFTLRENDLAAFRLYRLRSRHSKLIDGNGYEILLDLMETKIEQLADVIENTYTELEKINHLIIKNPEKKNKVENHLNQAIASLTRIEDMSSKVGLCLMDTQRALSFLLRKKRLPQNQLEQAQDILRDIDSLSPHNDALFQKVNFLMQAAMGFINIEQNNIMKFFSVISVMFLPATLVASTYGMNFEFMPELKMTYGYPMAVGLMVTVASLPYFYFKKKGWL